jgi:hypothetical protein
MTSKFVAIYNTLYNTRFRTAAAILTKRATEPSLARRMDGRIDVAFNVLAISEGLRDAGLMGESEWAIPTSWQPAEEWQLVVEPWRPGTAFVASSRSMTAAQAAALVAGYTGNDRKVNEEMGRRFGYFQPIPDAADGTVSMRLHLPNVPFDTKRDKMYTILSEFGPQSVTTASIQITALRALQQKWQALAGRVHPDLEVFVSLDLW